LLSGKFARVGELPMSAGPEESEKEKSGVVTARWPLLLGFVKVLGAISMGVRKKKKRKKKKRLRSA